MEVPDLRPSWGMEVKYAVSAADGAAVAGTIHNTIHRLGGPDAPGTAGGSP